MAHRPAARTNRIRESATQPSRKRATDTMPVPMTTAPDSGAPEPRIRDNTPPVAVAGTGEIVVAVWIPPPAARPGRPTPTGVLSDR